jgi:hypothetical protein
MSKIPLIYIYIYIYIYNSKYGYFESYDKILQKILQKLKVLCFLLRVLTSSVLSKHVEVCEFCRVSHFILLILLKKHIRHVTKKICVLTY